MRTYISQRLVCLAVTMGLGACGGSDLTLPDDGSPASLRAFSGDGQEATVGSRLPKPLVVHLTDRGARPVPGVTVAFRFEGDVPGAEFEPASIATNENGLAAVEVRLGTIAGPQTIEARLADNASSGLSTTFGVTALSPQDDDDGRGRDRGRGGGNDDDD